MIKVISLSEGRKTRHTFSTATKHTGLMWVDVVDPSHEDIEKIHKNFGIDKSDIAHSLDPHEVSRVDSGKYTFIIFRTPLKGDKSPKTTPIGIFILSNKIITIHKHLLEPLTQMQNSTNLHFGHVGDFLGSLIEKILSSYLNTLMSMDEEMEIVEENIFMHSNRETPMHIFSLKKSLIYFQQSLAANRNVLADLREKNPLSLKRGDINIFNDLYDECIQLITMANTHKEILTSALDIHTSVVSNKLNQIIKKMTVIGSFVLIPTLIASIYGMNFGQPVTGQSIFNMPELSWALGYPFSLLLMAISIILLYVYFKKNRWM